MKKLMMALSVVAILALPGCCCKRTKVAPKKVTAPAKTKKKKVKAKKPKKHAHLELQPAEELFA